MTEQIRLSFSAASDWRSCQQRYWYRYQERLRPIIESAAPTLGRVLHDFLAEYYGALQRQKKTNAPVAYRKATKALRAKDEELQKLAWAARTGGSPDVAASLIGVLPHALDLAEAYHRVRGEDDAEQHEVILVERRLEYPGTEEEFLEEQRRLFYVSITRSKCTLVLSRAKRIRRGAARRLGLSVNGWNQHWANLEMCPFLRDIMPCLPEAQDGDSMSALLG